MTPPFSSPGPRAFRQAPPKKHGRRFLLELKIQRKFEYVLGAVLCRKSGQHGPNLDPKMEPKSMKHEVENQSNFQCLLESIFYTILVDF